jgi:exodeoxyribonuclease VII small subunit
MNNEQITKEMGYGEAVAELEKIVAKMESDQCDIDQLSTMTTRALELLKFCKERLFKVDKEVERCLEELKTTLNA